MLNIKDVEEKKLIIAYSIARTKTKDQEQRQNRIFKYIFTLLNGNDHFDRMTIDLKEMHNLKIES